MHDFLLIDDNETFAALLMRSFVRRKLNLQWAKNSEEALSQSARFDGIILDLNLDGESGLRLLPLLKEKHPESKIIVLTGFASISTAVSAVKLGAVHYLPKPATVSGILQAFTGNEEHAAATEIAAEPPSLKRLTWEHIQYTLEQNEGNVSATARALNMHRRTLQRMLAKHPVKK
ncbi:MAG: response regulator [Neisseria sp.]|nr:response regulator [Neisseria sp.]